MNAQQLKNSILQMAVQGKLVPQDPNDEPASVLLERIREEKAAMVKAGKIKKEKNPSVIFRGEDNLFYEQVGKGKPVCIADELPFEIPDSWEWVRLSSLVYLVGNKYNQILAKEVKRDGVIPAVSQGASLIDGYCDNISKAITDIPVVIFGDHTRNVKYIDFRFVISADGTKIMRPFAINIKYLYYWMTYAAEHLRNRGYARHYSLLAEQFVPLPPKNEQLRIVSKIEEVLPFIKKYGEVELSLSTMEVHFPDRLKKSILQQAVQGKLVPQDPNDEPASVLLERIRKEKTRLIKEGKIKRDKHESIIYRRDNSHYETVDGVERCIDEEIPFEIPGSWAWVRLGSLLTTTEAGKSPQCENYPRKDDEWGVIKTTAIQDGLFLPEENKVLPIGFEVTESQVIHQNDLLITRAGPRSRTGIMCVVETEPTNLILSDKTVRLAYISDSVNPNYLRIALSSPAIQTFVIAAMTGMASSQVNISQEKMKTFLVPLPPFAEQKRIFLYTDKLLQTITLLDNRDIIV